MYFDKPSLPINIKRLRQGALLPRAGSPGSAGQDLCACLDNSIEIRPGETVKIPTGIAIQLPSSGLAAFVYARSGLGTKHNIVLANCVGVIDSDYRGEILVALINQSDRTFTVSPGDRIAQLVIGPVILPVWEESEALEDTQRGDGGFGSTGIG